MQVYVIGTRGFPNIQGGIEKHCEEIYPILSNKYNYDILILTTLKPLYNEFKNIKFKRIFTIRQKSLEKIIYSLNATLYCLIKRPDIVHIQGLNSALAIPILRLFGLKTIYTQHSMDYLYPKWGFLAKKILLFLEYCATFANEITVVSPLIQNRFKKKYNINTKITYNGVQFNKQISDKNYHFYKHKLKDKKYILFVGRITAEKDLITLIKAFNLINKELYLVLVGAVDYADKYTKDIFRLVSNNNQIILTGKIDNNDLPIFYKNALIFILPSKYEAFPIVLLEAIFNLSEILLSDIEALKQFNFFNEKNYFEVGNITNLIKKIEYIIDNPTSIEDKLKLKNKILSLYTWEDSADIFSKIYEKII